MKNFWIVYSREMRAYFTSPVAYIFICIFLAIMGLIFFFVFGFFQSAVPDIGRYFWLIPFTLVFFVPALTMRLWAEEKNSGTMELLMTFPISSWEAVLGKFFAGFSMIAVTLVLTLAVPLTCSWVVSFDWYVVAASYIGALCLAALYTSVGTWTSAMTKNPLISLVVAWLILGVLSFVGTPLFMIVCDTLISGSGTVVGWFGAFSHFDNFQKGIVNPVDFVYAFSLTGFFLVLNNFAVEWRKY